jgi:ParB/RepB/Spo0J family partition protein
VTIAANLTASVFRVKLDEVKTLPDRQRKEMGDVESLAESLIRWGQLNPIILDEHNHLIAGERRLTAARMNGWTHIEARYRNTLSDLELQELELEENLQRKDLTWQERTDALARIHELKISQNPNWSQQQTAALGEVNQRKVSEAIQLSKAMEVFPELKEAKSTNQALSWLKAKAANVIRRIDVKNNPAAYSDIESKILLGDSVDVIKRIPDESIHLVLTDPPFGINYDERTAGTEGTLTAYQDDEQAYLRLLSMAPDLYRVVKPNGWLVWFLGISWYERAKLAFRSAGFIVDEIPIIWDRSEGRTFTSRPDRYFARSYDIALHCIKGDPQVVQRNKPNILRVMPVTQAERVTLVERPVELYAELIRRLTVPGETVADFFVGGGGCPAAAASLNRDFIGCELDPERRAYAIQKIKAHLPTG